MRRQGSKLQNAGRSRRLGVAMLAAGSLLAAGVAQAGPAIQHYANARFGFSLDLPAELVAEPPPDNGDGQAFHAPDGSLRVTVSWSNNALGESLRESVARDRADCLHQPPEYLLERSDQIVFSCTSSEDILYQKTLRRGRGMDAAFVSLRIRYPIREKARWQAAVVTASNTFRLVPTSARGN